MDSIHPKSVRRVLLAALYHEYRADPLRMLTPEEVLASAGISRKELLGAIYYLHDHGLVELMTGYAPPLFAAARLTARGVDVVEDRFEFDRRFPPALNEAETLTARLPYLVERLAWEADLMALNRDERDTLLRDIHYLRGELARPAESWRWPVIRTVFGWILSTRGNGGEDLPSADDLRQVLLELGMDGRNDG